MKPTPPRPRTRSRILLPVLALALAPLLAPADAPANDWYRWRGPEQNGVSREKNLPETWDPDTGENVAWKADIGGMSSPVVMKGKVYTLNRINETKSEGTVTAGPQTQEALICTDAKTGKLLWQHAENMYQTDVPFHRVGWSNVTGDPESNRVYALGAQNMLMCLDADTGKEVWKRQMSEEFGLITTFGGRAPTPAIDEDRVYVACVAFGWGDNAKSQYRVFCLDKNTGEFRWTTGTGGIPVDAPYQTPVVAVINGERLVVTGAGDGSVTAFQARTGKKVWTHKISKRGSSSSVVVDDKGRVYASHSEENLKGNRMGAVVCIDASSGQPKEAWRTEGIEAGFGSPTIVEDTLYVIDNGAGVNALDVNTGKAKWRKKFGTIGKASLAYGDGKLYVAEANGHLSIVSVDDKKPEVLSKATDEEKFAREYAIFGSVAISDGRVYLQTANHLYCIGPKDAAPQQVDVPAPPKEEPAGADAKPAQVVVLPADAVVKQGGTQKFRAVAFDEKGREIGDLKDAQWSIGKLTFEAPPKALPATPTNREAPPGGQPSAAAVPGSGPAAADAPATPGGPAAGAEAASAGQPKGRRDAGNPPVGAGGETASTDKAQPAAAIDPSGDRFAAPSKPSNNASAATTAKPGGAPGGPAGAAPGADAKPETIQIGNLYGEIATDGTYKAPGDAGALLGGAIVAKAGDATGFARVRVVPPFPWTIGFTNAAAERPPLTWIGAGGKFAVQALKSQGPGASQAPEKVLTKLTNIDLYARARTYLGTADMSNYTFQADVKVDSKDAGGRPQVPDVGIINSRYMLVLYGNHQRAELHAWQPPVPYVLHTTMKYEWQPGKWYRLKLRVDAEGDKTIVRGKVWPRDGAEPGDWTLSMEDTLPNPSGSPGLFGNSLVTPFQSFVYYDNLLVTDNKQQGHVNAQ